MKMLVTGGAGFMGSHVAEELLTLGHEVVVLDDLSGGFLDNVPSGAFMVEGSITDEGLIKKLFSEHRFDYVYHLAAYAAEGLSHFIRRFNYDNNLLGSVNLINAAVNHRVKCFVFTSSIAVYGSQKPPFSEDQIPAPIDPYGIAKYAVELDLKAAQEMWGLNYVIFRPHNVYGERQNIADKYRNVIGIFMNRILAGQDLPVFGDGKQTRAFSYIGDIDHIIARSVFEKKALNQVFNVGADKEYSVNQLAEMVLTVMAKKNKIQYLPARHEAIHAFSSHEKVREVFGYLPKVDLGEGVERMARWVKKMGARQSQPFSNIEVAEGLPPSWR